MQTKSGNGRRYQVRLGEGGYVIARFRDYDRAVKHAQWAARLRLGAVDVIDSATNTVVTSFEGV
jgi:hypothetical protein